MQSFGWVQKNRHTGKYYKGHNEGMTLDIDSAYIRDTPFDDHDQESIPVSVVEIRKVSHLNQYVVKKGDTLTGICRDYHVNLVDVIRINRIKNPDLIRIFDVLILPPAGFSCFEEPL